MRTCYIRGPEGRADSWVATPLTVNARRAKRSLMPLFSLSFLVVSLLTAWRPITAQVAAPPMVTLNPGDVLRIAVWRHPEFSGDFPVAGDGSLVHPLYRVVKVGGVPLPVAEGRIRDFLAQYETNPAFVVVPLLRVGVSGQVRQPNLLTLPPETTIAQALMLAGGPTDVANLEHVHLIRGGALQDLDLTLPNGPAMQMRVQSGDQIVVEQRTNRFRDVIGPLSGVVAALASITTIIITLSR